MVMKIFKKKPHEIILLISVLVFILYFSYLSVIRVNSFNSHYYDLGIMNQVVYNTSRGRVLEMTNPTFNQNLSRLAIHFDPILVLFAPLYLIFSHFSLLLIFQGVIVAMGAIAVYKLSHLIIKKKLLSLFFSLIYLLNFQIERAVLFDFHPVVLVTGILLWAAYFYEKKNYFWFYFFIFLSLLTKEHLGLIVFFWGSYLFIFKRDFKNGVLISLLGMIFFIAINNFIIPYFRGEVHFAFRYYSNFGDSSQKIFFNLLKNPFLILEKIIAGENWAYHQRLITGNFYSLFSFLTLLIALPEYLINLLSANSNMRSYYFHYQSVIIAFSFYSLILGYKKFNEVFRSQVVRRLALIIFISGNIYLYHFYSPLPFFTKEPVKYKINKDKLKTVLFWQRKLNDEKIKISTTPKIAPFFTQRIYYYNFLYDPSYHSLGYSDEQIFAKKSEVYKLADYVIIDKDEVKTTAAVRLYNNFLKDKHYQLVYNKSNILVYKKK